MSEKTENESSVIDGIELLHKLVGVLASRHQFFHLDVSRYNAIGGDMWHVLYKTGDSTKDNYHYRGSHGAIDLDLRKAVSKLLKVVGS